MFCPSCSAEYRPGFTTCAHCEVALVEALEEKKELRLADFDDTAAVGVASSSEVSNPAKVDGRVVDLMRVHGLEVARELRGVFEAYKVASIITPLELEFPDHRPRFELRVRKEDHARAEELLRQVWSEGVAAEGTDVAEEEDPENCPACGSHVPADAEECPDCGLYVGKFEG